MRFTFIPKYISFFLQGKKRRQKLDSITVFKDQYIMPLTNCNLELKRFRTRGLIKSMKPRGSRPNKKDLFEKEIRTLILTSQILLKQKFLINKKSFSSSCSSSYHHPPFFLVSLFFDSSSFFFMTDDWFIHFRLS